MNSVIEGAEGVVTFSARECILFLGIGGNYPSEGRLDVRDTEGWCINRSRHAHFEGALNGVGRPADLTR